MNQENFSSNAKHFLKEYTCYSFNDMLFDEKKPLVQRKINFRPAQNIGGCELPIYRIDDFADEPTLYMFKWKFGQCTKLDIFLFKSDDFLRIEMTNKPTFVDIVDKHIYIVGGNQLFVISIQNPQNQIVYNLGNSEVVEMSKAVIENDVSGVIVYYWNENKGHEKRTFSPRSGESEGLWSGIRRSFSLLSKRQQIQRTYLKVVIPNILGLVFHNNEEFSLMNLTTMQIVEDSRQSLTNWEITNIAKATVKCKQNECSKDDDDSLLISIASGQNIELFILHLKYKEQAIQIFQKRSQKLPQISELRGSYSINWRRIVMMPYITLKIEGQIIDHLLLERGLLYFCENPRGNKIPIGNYIQYFAPTLISPVLSLEHNIWKQFVNDIYEKRNDSLTTDRLLIPNRYSIPFVLQSMGYNSIADIQGTEINPQKLVSDWVRLYQLRNIVIFSNEVLLIRECSLSSFLQIDEFQFERERQDNKENTDIWAIMNDSKSRISVGTNSVQNFQNESLFNGFYFQYNSLIQAEDNFKEPQPERPILKFVANLQKNYKQTLQPNLNLKDQTFCRELLINKVKDVISYYEIVLKEAFFVKVEQAISHEPFNSEKLIIHYLTSFKKMSNKSSFQVNAHGEDVLTIFINNCFSAQHFAQRSSVNIECETWRVIQMLFTNIVPMKIPSYGEQKNQNKFIKFLLNNSHLGYEYSEYLLLQLFNPPKQVQLPFTTTILSAYLKLPFETDIIYKYIRCFLLNLQSNSVGQFIHWLNCSQIKKNVKSLIKAEILKMGLYSQQLTDMQAEEDAEDKFNDSMIHMEENSNQYFAVQDLAYNLERSVITVQKYMNENQLVDLEDKGLEDFFTKSLELNLAGKSLENILEGWSLYFKAYVQKLIRILDEEGTKSDFHVDEKKKALQYLKKCQKGLNNFGQYYQKLYSQRKQQEEILTVHLGNYLVLGKLLTRGWINILRFPLQNENYTASLTINNILFFHLSAVLQRGVNENVVDIFNELKNYFHKRQMSNMIMGTYKLREMYEKQKEEVRVFFGYSEVNRIVKFDPHIYEKMRYRNPYVEANLGL